MNENDARQSSIIKPKRHSGNAAQPSIVSATADLKRNSEKATTLTEVEDLWSKARQRLTQNRKMAPILEEAAKIVEESGLKLGSHGAADHQQLHHSLNAKFEELK